MATGTLQIAPPTFEDPFVEQNGRLSSEAFNWIVITLLPRITGTAAVFGTTPPYQTETPANDAIALTPLPLGSLTAGVYRVMVYLRVTTPDGVSSSVTPILSFPDDGVTCQMEGAAMTTDNIAEPVSQAFLVSVDAPGPISFGTAYASNTPNLAQYKAIVTVERVQ